MNIGITGDTHGDTSFSQIVKAKKLHMTHLIICGDFGYIWDNSIKEERRLNYLSKMGIEILFIDGNHENHILLKEYPITTMYEGKVHKIRNNIIHLIRGEVYKINQETYFVFGGANSTDIEYRKEGKTWWKEEKPSEEDKTNAYINLKKHNYKVDYVLTHTCYPLALTHVDGDTRIDDVSNYLASIREKIKYKYWFFGHMHKDYDISDLNTRCIYNDVIKIKM